MKTEGKVFKVPVNEEHICALVPGLLGHLIT